MLSHYRVPGGLDVLPREPRELIYTLYKRASR